MSKKYNSDETIAHIIQVATALFIEKGYEKTTIQDIVANLDGLSRGAIYHHFDSKDAIIAAVNQRLFPETQMFEVIKSHDDMTGLEKLKHFFVSLTFNEELAKFYAQSQSLINNPQFLVRQLLNNSEVVAPQIRFFIDEGNADGSLKVENPKAVSEITMLVLSTWFLTAIYPATIAEFNSKILVAKQILDNLGVPIIDDSILTKIADILNGNNK